MSEGLRKKEINKMLDEINRELTDIVETAEACAEFSVKDGAAKLNAYDVYQQYCRLLANPEMREALPVIPTAKQLVKSLLENRMFNRGLMPNNGVKAFSYVAAFERLKYLAGFKSTYVPVNERDEGKRIAENHKRIGDVKVVDADPTYMKEYAKAQKRMGIK